MLAYFSRTLVAFGLAATLACVFPLDRPPRIPDPDLSEMEPPVAKLLADSRREVLDAPYDADSWGRLAAVWDAHGLRAEAEIGYARAAELDVAEFRWLYLLAIAREANGATQAEQIERYAAAAALRQDYAPLWVRTALVHRRGGELERAREAFRRAVDLDPRSADGWRGLGQLELAADRPDVAREHLGRALELTPQDAAVHAALAQALGRQGLNDEAERAALQAQRLTPRETVRDPLWTQEVWELQTSGSYRFSRGLALAEAGRYAEALVELRLAETVMPEAYDVQFMLGYSYGKLGEHERAVPHLTSAVALDPDRLQGRLELARALERLGGSDAALPHYRRAQQLAPMDADVQFEVGSALARMQLYDEAVRALTVATTMEPGNADAHYRLGAALELLGRLDEARTHYRQAVSIDPQHTARERL